MLPSYISNAVSTVKDYSAQIALGGLFAVVMGACSGGADTPTISSSSTPPRSTPISTMVPIHTENPTPLSLNPTIDQEPKLDEVVSNFSEKPTYEQVKAGDYSRKDYISFLTEDMPELKEALDKGLLQGVYFDLHGEELEQVLSEYLTIRGYDETSDDYENALKSIFEQVEVGLDAKLAITLNDESNSDRLPSVMFVTNNFFNVSDMRYDNDARTVLRHEFKHVRDQVLGIGYDGELVDMERLSPTVRYSLEEFRALKLEFEHLFNHLDEVPSIARFSSNVTFFLEHAQTLTQCPST